MTQPPPRIDELAHKKLLALLLFTAAMLIFCGFIIANVWDNLDEKLHIAALAAYGMSGATTLAMLVRLLCCRVHIDETGVSADHLFGNACMTWPEVKTAAIVRLVLGGQKSDAFIVLSSREPAVVLTHQALTTQKVLTRDEVVRIPLSYDRSRTVEHYLHMKLPEFTL